MHPTNPDVDLQVDPEPADAPREESAEPSGEEPAEPVATGGTVSFAFNLGKIEGHGEDSDPILRQGPDLGLVAVFDGMGGAGGTVYETPDGPRTGAYLASRLARDAVEEQMLASLDPTWDLDGPAAARDLQRVVQRALRDRLAELAAPPSGLRSRLLRALPTTMALLALQRRSRDGDVWDCHALWAGDSRAYVLDPATGAHQLTVDDIRDGGDAMANLREDSVVSNAMSADTDFVVHHRVVRLTVPFLVVVATDGCFGYLPTPMHFEHLVLAALRGSDDAQAWSSSVQAAVAEVTGDDAAMAVWGVGADIEGFRQLFSARTAELESGCVAPLDAVDAEVRQAQDRLDELRRSQHDQREQLWAEYRSGYERYLGASREGSS